MLLKKIPIHIAKGKEDMPIKKEIKEAIWSCDLTKAPGFDGYNMEFIKECWPIIGDEICPLHY